MLKSMDITTRSIEAFQYCLQALEKLNKIFEVVNNDEFYVNLEVPLFAISDGSADNINSLIVTPVMGEMKPFRVKAEQVDFHVNDGYVWIKHEKGHYKINLRAKSGKATV